MEQLIPPSLLAEYGISTQTPLMGPPVAEPPIKVIMEVPETETAIRAALIALGEKPMICQEKGKREKKEMTENKRKLQKIADIAGKKLVYVKDPSITLTSLITVGKVGGKKAAET
jgi:hypothetical protein